MQASEHGRSNQLIAWLCVCVIHAGLFWLLLVQGRVERTTDIKETRLRLVLMQPALRAAAPTATASIPSPKRSTQAFNTPKVEHARPAPRPIDSAAPPSASTVATQELLQQAGAWTREPVLSFVADPLRSRRAQLPGGDRQGAFRMREPPSPARAMESIASFFGDPGPPCPRVQARLNGLLTATSEKDRELLQEELRRDRQFCQP